MLNQLVKLVVDEEVQGYTQMIHGVDELKEKVNALLDERVVEVRIAKKKDCQGNPISKPYSEMSLAELNDEYYRQKEKGAGSQVYRELHKYMKKYKCRICFHDRHPFFWRYVALYASTIAWILLCAVIMLAYLLLMKKAICL